MRGCDVLLRHPAALVVCAGMLFAVPTVRAASKPPPAVRLIYERAANVPDCPDENTVLDAVRARLAFDPFREPAEIIIRASLLREGEELRARIRWSDRSSKGGERRLSSRRADCTELASAMELALSIAIDPLALARAPEPPAPLDLAALESEPAATKPAEVESAPKAHKPAAASSPWPGLELLAGAVGDAGDTVGLTLGALAGVGLRGTHWSLSLEGRADLPRSRSAAGGSVEAGTLAVTLAPCLRHGIFGGCVLASLDALRASGQNLNNAQKGTSLYAAVGARALVEYPQGGWLAGRAHVDVARPLPRTLLKVGDDEIWSSPFVTVALGLAAVVRLP
jgi:hypothetical protein